MSREEGQQLARMEAELARLREENEGLSARNRDLEEEVEEGLLLYARDQAIAERDRLRETERKLIGDTNFLGKRLAEQNDELTRLREEVADADEDRKSDQAELARLRESRSALEASNVDLIIERDRLREDLVDATVQEGRKDKELARLRVYYETLYTKEVEENARLRKARTAVERSWLQQETELQELRGLVEEQHAALVLVLEKATKHGDEDIEDIARDALKEETT